MTWKSGCLNRFIREDLHISFQEILKTLYIKYFNIVISSLYCQAHVLVDQHQFGWIMYYKLFTISTSLLSFCNYYVFSLSNTFYWSVGLSCVLKFTKVKLIVKVKQWAILWREMLDFKTCSKYKFKKRFFSHHPIVYSE